MKVEEQTSNLQATSLILSTFASDRPFTSASLFFVIIITPFTVQIPTACSFLISAMFCKNMEFRQHFKDELPLSFEHNQKMLATVKNEPVDTTSSASSEPPDFLEFINKTLANMFKLTWKSESLSMPDQLSCLDMLSKEFPYAVNKKYRAWRFGYVTDKVPSFINNESEGVKNAVRHLYATCNDLEVIGGQLLDLRPAFKDQTQLNDYLKMECIIPKEELIDFKKIAKGRKRGRSKNEGNNQNRNGENNGGEDKPTAAKVAFISSSSADNVKEIELVLAAKNKPGSKIGDKTWTLKMEVIESKLKKEFVALITGDNDYGDNGTALSFAGLTSYEHKNYKVAADFMLDLPANCPLASKCTVPIGGYDLKASKGDVFLDASHKSQWRLLIWKNNTMAHTDFVLVGNIDEIPTDIIKPVPMTIELVSTRIID
ncbi:hypothetical protein WR25_02223 [Diploscapter pachys]|uniref:Uncharacterized protein n=1 Tax=Diploscapter pachys TaxID=2018661 RepID=A0A2A2M1D1_9BILA|nr:hypothetical protein WR25_02223 [Diploscapter pachys]